jgi:hypothetical protein
MEGRIQAQDADQSARRTKAMLTAEEIKKSIIQLPEKEYRKLRKWFSEREWEEWDKKIAQDAQAGRLDFLAEEAARGLEPMMNT